MHVWIGKENFNFAEYDVYLDGVKQLYVFEVDEEHGKLWRNVMENGEFKKVGMSEELVVECLRGKVELRRIDQQSQTRGTAQGPYSNYQMFTQHYVPVADWSIGYGTVIKRNVNGEWIYESDSSYGKEINAINDWDSIIQRLRDLGIL